MTNHDKPEIAIPMKEEIISQLEELLKNENILTVQKEFNQLSSKFKTILSEEAEAAKPAEQTTAETSASTTDTKEDVENAEADQASTETELSTSEQIPESETPKEIEVPEKSDASTPTAEDATEKEKEVVEIAKDPIQVKFEALADNFRAKIKTAVEAKHKLEKETVESAKKFLEELRALVANEENIGKAFAGFNEIKDKWKELPKVSNDAYRDLNAEYNKVVEKFFYNINIYKELKDLDLKHNLDEKLKVLEDQKKLLELNDVRLLEVEVRMNQDRWNEIGPTFKENWDKLKDEFWSVTREIYKKVQQFYDVRRGEQDKNLDLKHELLNKVKYIDSLELKAHKKWQEKTKEIIDIQKEWKMIGFVPKEHSSKLWKEFRTICDNFFEKKRKHYEDVHAVQNTNKEAKLALLAKAEELKESEDWNATSDLFIKLQKDWKKIGPAHQRDENKLWRKFRDACDKFFESRKGHKQEETGKQIENLAQKVAFLTKLEAYEPDTDKKASLGALKDFANEWREIGHVPFKEKDKINKQYKSIMDEKYGKLNIDKKQKEQIRFEQKVEDFKDTDQSDHLIRKEHDQIRHQISKLNSEIIQFENNMGFFASSAGADKFKAEIEKKISKAKEEKDVLQNRLSVLRKL